MVGKKAGLKGLMKAETLERKKVDLWGLRKADWKVENLVESWDNR